MTMLLLNWNPRLTFYDTRKKIWIRGVDYEIAVAITNPLKTITGPRKKMKMLKIDLKKVPSPKFFLHDYVGTMAQLFTKKKNLTSQSLYVASCGLDLSGVFKKQATWLG